ncbi:MAG: hypothetical protein HOC79_03735 [Euryarchaeota archaeon]|nr:hypothetical protein [Euryarchaeota archaeon]MBT4406965.1 hypothetical protein [Euryarchaeota archaeon]
MAKELDTRKSHLWAQVRKARVNHLCEEESNFLRPAKYPVNARKVLLGDIAEMVLHTFGPHETPVFSTPPKFDEQSWSLAIQDSELKVEIISRPYWGFGLFSLCYINEITITGQVQRRCRLIYDMLSSLSHRPWEAARQNKFAKVSGKNIGENAYEWQKHIEYIENEFKAEINSLMEKIAEHQEGAISGSNRKLFNEAKDDIEMAEAALRDNNSFAIERALSRVEEALIEADPDYESNVLALKSTSESAQDSLDLIMNETGSNSILEDQIDEIPFVDLSNELSEEEDIPLVDLTSIYEEE